jgi:hypothetical protein
MAFTGNFSCNTLRAGLANGSINLTSDTFRLLALYTNDATLDQTTTAYTQQEKHQVVTTWLVERLLPPQCPLKPRPAGSVTYIHSLLQHGQERSQPVAR